MSSPATTPDTMNPVHHRHILLFILIDGIGDVTLKALADATHTLGRTPLQAAHTPTLDRLAQFGLCGLMDSVEPGQACGSDTAHLSILGYDPLLYYRGRGAFESMGAGLEMEVGDIAFKSNFATIDESESATGDGIVKKRRADRSFHEWGIPLCDALDGAKLPSFPDIEVSVRYATEHRCGVRLRGKGLTDCISGTDPLVDGKQLRKCMPTDKSPAAARTSAIVNECSNVFCSILAKHPINVKRAAQGLPIANVVLLRGAGARISVPRFSSHGLGRGCILAPTAIISGLGQSVGLEIIKCEGATGDYRTDLNAKAKAILAALQGTDSTPSVSRSPAVSASPAVPSSTPSTPVPSVPFDFGLLHIKAVDDAGHDRDVRRKIEFLEKTDGMIEGILSTLKQDQDGNIWTLVVTGDHSTPVMYGDHTCEPVPFMATTLQCLPEFAATCSSTPPAIATLKTALAASSIRSFDELSCASGSLGRFPGREVVPLLKRIKDMWNGVAPTTASASASDPSHHKPSFVDAPSHAAATQLHAHPVERAAQ